MKEILYVNVGDVVVVPLPEDRSTDFKWEFLVSPGLVKIEDVVVPPKTFVTNLVGANMPMDEGPSTRVIRVRVPAIGTYVVKATYRKPRHNTTEFEDIDSISSEQIDSRCSNKYYLSIICR